MKKHRGATQTSPKKEKEIKSPAASGFLHPLIYLAGILILTVVVYSGSLRNEILTFDDNEYFQDYPEVLQLTWNHVVKYFSSYYVIMYQPLPVLTFAINYYFTGMNTFPMHMVNLILHLACIILVFRFIRDLTGKQGVALFVALLFAIHPMNVEAVSWISARSSSMYTFFYLLSLISYLDYVKSSRIRSLIYCMIFFIFSLFSKAQAVTLPVVLLLLDYFYERKLLSAKVIYEKIPFFLLSLVFGIITLMNPETQHNITKGMMVSYNPFDMIFLVTYSFAFYLFKLILPVSLCAVYVFPPKEGGFLPWEYYASAVFIVALIYMLYRYRNNRQLIFCTGLFLVTIAINIQIVPSRLFIVTDRYAYFPYIGLFLLATLSWQNLKQLRGALYAKNKSWINVIPFFFVVLFVILTFNRTKAWASDIPFMTDIIEKNPPVGYIYRAYGNRGLAYKRNNQPEEALNDFTKALELNNDDSRTYYNRCLVYLQLNKNNLALEDVSAAIAIDSLQPLLFNTRSQLRLMQNDTSGSIADARKCIRLDSLNYDAYNTLATINFGRREFDSCEQNLTKAINANPKFSIAIKNRGFLYVQMNRMKEACADLMNASYLGNEEAKSLYVQYCK